MDAAINIHHVSKQFAHLTALSEINFTIPKGSFFGLLGPNGAGKSTLINIVAGLVFASQGQVEVMGYDVRQQWRQSRQALGVVPQELVYDPFFTVKELLELQSGYFGLGRENRPWLNELIEILNLTDKANTTMFRLSGGMKRRVLIAQALVHRPAVVVLDEPTAGVDIELRQVLWAFTQRLHEDGHTIVLTTHYLEEAEALCDRIAILNQGKLVALDEKQALLGRYPYRFLRFTLNTPQNTIQLPTALQEKVYTFKNQELVFKLHRQEDTISSVLDALREAGIQFLDLHTEEPSLEDVFLRLTHKT